MYINYGDRDFFENGMLVDSEHRDTEFRILACLPYPEEEGLYQFGDCIVDITDSWIDRKAVMDFVGMTEETFDPVQFAIACMGYYSWENFGANQYFSYDWTQMTKKEICGILRHRLIAADGLDICW